MGVKSFYRRIDLINKSNKLNLLNQKDQILLSFSGGQDSICLLFLLNQLYSQLELHITLFWCHHLWQTDSFYLMQQIAKLSFLFQFNSCFAIPSTSLSNELLARKWRQSCSYRVSLFYNNSKICLAHTFNDKVETIFFNFMRGTGLTKLSPLRREQFIYKSSTTNEKHIFRHQNLLTSSINPSNILLCFTPSLLCTTRTKFPFAKELAKPMQGSLTHLKNISKQLVREFCYAKNCSDFDSLLLLQICDFAMQYLHLYRELFLLHNQVMLTSCPCEAQDLLTKSIEMLPKGEPCRALYQIGEFFLAPHNHFSGAQCFELARNDSCLLQKITCNRSSIKQVRSSARKPINPLRTKLRRDTATQAIGGYIDEVNVHQAHYFEGIRLSLTSYCKGSKKGVSASTNLVISLVDQSRFEQGLTPKENKSSSLLTYSEGVIDEVNRFLVPEIALLTSFNREPFLLRTNIKNVSKAWALPSKAKDVKQIFPKEKEQHKAKKLNAEDFSTKSIDFLSFDIFDVSTESIKKRAFILTDYLTNIFLWGALTGSPLQNNGFSFGSEARRNLYFSLVKQADVNSAKMNLLGKAQALLTTFTSSMLVRSKKQMLTTGSLLKGVATPQKSIARPLLSMSRFEIKKICFFWRLPIYPDTSNQKVKFLRNRVRRQLSPTIKFFFNSKIETIFLQLAEIVETEDYRFTQIVNEFTKNIDLYDAKLQTHPIFTLLEKKRFSSYSASFVSLKQKTIVSSSFVHPIKNKSIRLANEVNDLSTKSINLYSPFALLGEQKPDALLRKVSVKMTFQGAFTPTDCFANIVSLQSKGYRRNANVNLASQGRAHSLLNSSLSKETEKSKLCLPLAKQKDMDRTASGISNAKSTVLVMDEFKNLKFLDLLIQLIEINKFSNNVSLLTKLIANIACQKNEAQDTKFSKMLIFRFFETYHLTNLDIKKLKKKFAKEPTKIINVNILTITPITTSASLTSPFCLAPTSPVLRK